jgi:uncharacterized protein
MQLDRDEVVVLTEEYGGPWGINHTRRLLQLVDLIDGGQDYDVEAVWLAAHLHDWGGYEAWAQPGVDHALRSAEVASDFLRARACPEERIDVVLEAIRTHHSAGPGRRLEAALLSDADALDFLGAVGVLRTFSMVPRNLRGACEKAKERRQRLPRELCLQASRDLAEARLAEMDELFRAFEDEAFGLY